MQRATAQRMNQALPRALCSLFPAASRALTWRAHERERYNSRRRKERRRLARWRAREGRRRTRATTERKRWSFFFSFTRARFLSVFFFDNFESVTHPLFSNTSFFFPLLARSTPPSFNKSCSQMASLRPSLGASRVGSCIGRGGKAVSRVVVALPPTPLGRQTTNAVVVASSPSSASSSQQPYVPSETRPTRPEHAGRQLDSSGSASTRVRRRSRRRRQGDANASAASASASAPSFEQTSSSALEGGSGVDSEPFGSSGAELSAPEGE
jgi:hypothetical protein